jgi:hypothetical protein
VQVVGGTDAANAGIKNQNRLSHIKRDLSYVRKNVFYIKRDPSYVKEDPLTLAYLHRTDDTTDRGHAEEKERPVFMAHTMVEMRLLMLLRLDLAVCTPPSPSRANPPLLSTGANPSWRDLGKNLHMYGLTFGATGSDTVRRTTQFLFEHH